MARKRVRRLRQVTAGVLSWWAIAPHSLGQTAAERGCVEVPIRFRHGDLLVTAHTDGLKPLTFKLDSGFGITTIKPELAEKLGLERAGRLVIDGIAGEESAATYRGANFDFGGEAFRPRRVAALPSE